MRGRKNAEKFIPFVRNEHTCLLSDDANFSPRLPTNLDYWQVTQSVECRSVKAKATGSNPVLSAKFIKVEMNGE